MRYGVAAFSSAHSALWAEKQLSPRFSVTMMPTPRCITASCGISLRLPPEMLGGVAAVLAALPEVSGCWELYTISDGVAEKQFP